MAKKKNNLLSNDVAHETRSKYKKTSIGGRPSTSMMNKKKDKQSVLWTVYHTVLAVELAIIILIEGIELLG